MAKINSICCPPNWAGVEWLRSYKSRHLELTLKKPEECSMARATAFNKETVKCFFDNLEVMDGDLSFGNGCRIYNLDKTATTKLQCKGHEKFWHSNTKSSKIKSPLKLNYLCMNHILFISENSNQVT